MSRDLFSLLDRGRPSEERDKDPDQPLLSDYMDSCEPIEATLQQLMEITEAHNLPVIIWRFSALGPGETLQAHVKRQAELGPVGCPGPHHEVSGHKVSRSPRWA